MSRLNTTSIFFCLTITCLTVFSLPFHSTIIEAADQKSSVKKLPIEYFTKNTQNRSIKMSPDGKHLIVVINNKGRDVFGIFDIAKKNMVRVIGVRGVAAGVHDVNWISNTRIVYSTYEYSKYDLRKNSSGELYGVNVDGSQHKIIFGYRAGQDTTGTRLKKRKASYASQEILDLLEGDDEHILIAYYPWRLFGNVWRVSSRASTLVKKLNVYNGNLSSVDMLPLSQANAIVDNNGLTRFAIGVNTNNESVVSYKETKDSDWQEFSLENFEGTDIYPFSFSQDNQSVYLSANVGEGTRALYLFNLKTKIIDKLFHDETIDLSRRVFDFAQRRIIYVATEKTLPTYHYLEPKNIKSKVHKKLMSAFKGQDVVITSSSKDGSLLVALIYSDKNPGDFYLFETKTLNATYLMSRNSWVYPEDLVSTEFVNIQTRDDQQIYGYLTRPKNSQHKQLPLVVYPHGGPHGVRDEWFYDWEVQLLANQGYAVLQVNFRGSGGFGSAFESSGYGKWGTLMQDDITDATLLMIEQKVADPKRICIYGASYGGYAALMGAVREPDLYQCAIGSAGVYDLPMMFEEGDIPEYSKSGLAYLRDAVGDDIEDLKRRSPLYNVDKIKANIMLIHGTKDERVPIEQALKLKQAFDDIGKPYRWLELSNEGHGYSSNENRKLIYQNILDFLEKNIGGKSDKE